jgi:hypothetical protein
MHAPHFLGLERHHSPGVRGQRYEKQLQDLCEDRKEVATMISLIRWDRNSMLLQHDNTGPHTSAATSVAIEGIGLEVVPNTYYSRDLAPPGFWLFAGLEKHLKGIHFACDEEVQVVLRTA